MDTSELTDHWHANKDRPAWVRANRDELMDAVNTSEPIPGEDGSIYEVREWLKKYKGTVSGQLNEVAGDGEGGE